MGKQPLKIVRIMEDRKPMEVWIPEDKPLGEFFRSGILWKSTVDEYHDEGQGVAFEGL